LIIRDLSAEKIGNLHLITLEFNKNPLPNLNNPSCTFADIENCACTNQESTDCSLLPDLIILEQFTKNQIKEYAWDHPTYPGQLRFAATIANIGDGPMETIGKNEWKCGTEVVNASTECPDGSYARQTLYQRIYQIENGTFTHQDIDAGTNYYDDKPGHDHFHVDNWVEFRLKKSEINSNGEKEYTLVTEGSKVSYCLFDSGTCSSSHNLCNWKDMIYDQQNLPNYGLGNYSSCKEKIQGISVGGYDTYGMFYEGQSFA